MEDASQEFNECVITTIKPSFGFCRCLATNEEFFFAGGDFVINGEIARMKIGDRVLAVFRDGSPRRRAKNIQRC